MTDKTAGLGSVLSDGLGPLPEVALQAVAEKSSDQCAAWYGIGARDVEAVLREAGRHGLVAAWRATPDDDKEQEKQ